ncbi:nitrate reductase cytochrome c-type subunit [Billgrantia tianxiuensis]|uniref:Periplasmic nitrate reductase, electron transfer subunit n=1 Tax=Billgrantia tianxiuensis TaxID=2497861 RepID=A0A6I6SUP5_9GAMM|nr:nitrate reductase cytochrome c-type subunit [Halomonas tianxiuensis]
MPCRLHAAHPAGAGSRGRTRSAACQCPLLEEREPEPLYGVEDRSLRPVREYPMQPPTIPHRIDNYQVDLNANRCMACHARTRVGETQAIMVSVTHYMDREGNFLGDLSPRRYFCTQCHVPQTDAPSRVGNTFVDMSDLIRGSRQRSE